MHEFEQLDYFRARTGRVPGTEKTPNPRGEIIVFESFFEAGLCFPCHVFVVKVLEHFNAQLHQLTSNAIVALSKYVWR